MVSVKDNAIDFARGGFEITAATASMITVPEMDRRVARFDPSPSMSLQSQTYNVGFVNNCVVLLCCTLS